MLPGNVRMNLVKRAKSNLDNNYSCNLLSQQTAMRKNNFKEKLDTQACAKNTLTY